MTWLVFKTGMSKFWIYFKKYWYIAAIIVAIIVTAILTGGKVANLVKLLKTTNDSYRDQIDVIQRTHEEELRKRDEAIKKYQETIDRIEKDYETKQQKLTEEEKKAVKKYTKMYNDDPNKLAAIIAEQFGVTYVAPTE